MAKTCRVFISYHVSDGASGLVRRIADELERMGISCWYAPRDVTPGAFVPSIMAAIDVCNVFLMVWDEGSNGPGYVFHELVYAFNRYKSKGSPIIIPFKIGDFQEYPDLRFYLAPFHIFQGGNAPEAARTDELITKIVDKLGAVTPERPEAAAQVRQPTPQRPEAQASATPERPETQSSTAAERPEAQASATPERPETKASATPRRSKRRLNLLVRVCLLLAIILAAFLANRISDKTPVETSDETPVATSGETSGITWDYSQGVLTVRGVGDMENYNFLDFSGGNPTPWNKYKNDILKVVISEGVTSIGNYAFYNCENLTEVSIPDGVTSIGNDAFSDCESLTDINIPDSVTSIGNSAFYACKSLTDINIPDSVTSIGSYAFACCHSLTDINIPDSVSSIGNRAFYGCNSLLSIMVSDANGAYASVDGVLFNKSMSEIVCYPAGKLEKEYAIPDSVTSIGNDAFYACKSLTDINIPDSVTSIGVGAFWGCSNLKRVSIPATAVVGYMAFPGTEVT